MIQSCRLLIPVQIEWRIVVLSLVILILISHVVSDHLFIDSYRGDEVSPAPEVLLLGWCLPVGEFKVGPDGTLPFQEAHDIGHTFSGRDGEDEMDMIGHRMAFENSDMPFLCKFSDDLANPLAYESVQFLLSIFWYNDHVVLAVPHDMTL